MQEIQQIQLYLEGKLSGDALLTFENKMREDQDFNKEVEDYRTIFDGMNHLRKTAFENQVREWNKELPDVEVNENPVLPNSATAKTARINPWFKRIAVVAIIGLLGLVCWMMQTDKTLDDFSEKNYIVLALDINRHELNSDFKRAEYDFENEDYNSCISKLELLLPSDPDYIKAQHLKGHAYYKINEYQKAIQSLSTVLNPGDIVQFNPTNKETAEWTAILASLEDYLLQPNPTKRNGLKTRVDEFLQKGPGKSYKERAADLKARL